MDAATVIATGTAIAREVAETFCRKFVERKADMADELGKQAGWVEYAQCVKALFEHDDDIIVSYDNNNTTVTLYVDNAIKADALMEMQARGIFPAERQYGNVTLKVEVVPANDAVSETDLYAAAFNGNPVFDGIAGVESMGMSIAFALFMPAAVQYYSDDLSEYGGITTTTYGELAKRVFEIKDVKISSSHLPEIVF